MRTIAVFSLLLLFSAPDFARDELRADEVERFVSAAEEMAQVPDLVPIRSQLPAMGQEIARRHGFDMDGWQVTARRVWSAYDAQRIAPALGVKPATAKLKGLTGPERGEFQVILAAAKGDLAFIAADTEADRTVIAPYVERLERLAN